MAKKQGDFKRSIRQLQIARAFLYIVAAIVVGVLLYSSRIQVTANYVTKDALASNQATQFAPAVRTLWGWPLAVDIILFLAVSAGFAVYQLTKAKTKYEKQLKAGVSGLRWLDFGVSLGLYFGVVAAVVGVHDLVSIKTVSGAILVTCLLGWLSEKQNMGAKKPVWDAYAISVLTGIGAWLFIVPMLVHTALYGMVRLPWYAYAVVGIAALCSIALAINQCNAIRKLKNWKNYLVVERNYLTIDLILKLSSVAILIIGLKK